MSDTTITHSTPSYRNKVHLKKLPTLREKAERENILLDIFI